MLNGYKSRRGTLIDPRRTSALDQGPIEPPLWLRYIPYIEVSDGVVPIDARFFRVYGLVAACVHIDRSYERFKPVGPVLRVSGSRFREAKSFVALSYLNSLPREVSS